MLTRLYLIILVCKKKSMYIASILLQELYVVKALQQYYIRLGWYVNAC